ncbi:MAG: hypothetical protein AB7F86_17085 [Bdellovibrionales bacterium]
MKNLAIVPILFGLMTAAHAALPPSNSISSDDQQLSRSTLVGLNGLYRFTKKSEVVPVAAIVDGEADENPGEVSVEMNRGELVLTETLPSGDILMTIQPGPGEENTLPSQFILSQEEMSALPLEFVKFGSAVDLKEQSDYVDTDVAARGRSRAKKRRHRVRQESSRRGRRHRFRRDSNGRIAGGGGNCVRVVKSLIGWQGHAGNGVGMASALRRNGWSVIGYGSRRRGTVCSWSGGWHGLGHVGWFDGSCFQPTYAGNCGHPGRRYSLRLCVTR